MESADRPKQIAFPDVRTGGLRCPPRGWVWQEKLQEEGAPPASPHRPDTLVFCFGHELKHGRWRARRHGRVRDSVVALPELNALSHDQ